MRRHISLFDLCCQRNDQKNIGIKITVIVLDNNGKSDAALLGTAVRIQIHHVDIPALVHPVCGHRRMRNEMNRNSEFTIFEENRKYRSCFSMSRQKYIS